MNGKLCSIYKSAREENLYLFVARDEGLERVPEVLLKRFGEPVLAMTLKIDGERKLAQANARSVLAAIEEKGYYLQLPPSSHSYMSVVRARNEKLPR